MKTDFVSTVSHELRTPLAAIYGAAMTLRRRDVAVEESQRDRLLEVVSSEADRLALATVLMLPVVFAFGAVGHALVGWRPRVAVVLMAAVAVISYFVEQFAPVFDAPDWVARTSFFTLYGTPMTSVDWGGAATLVGIGVAGTAAALVSMQRRDVGR